MCSLLRLALPRLHAAFLSSHRSRQSLPVPNSQTVLVCLIPTPPSVARWLPSMGVLLRLTPPRLHSALSPPVGHPAAPPRTGEVLPGYRALTFPPSPPVLPSLQAPPQFRPRRFGSHAAPVLSARSGDDAADIETRRTGSGSPITLSPYKSLVRAPLRARSLQKTAGGKVLTMLVPCPSVM